MHGINTVKFWQSCHIVILQYGKWCFGLSQIGLRFASVIRLVQKITNSYVPRKFCNCMLWHCTSGQISSELKIEVFCNVIPYLLVSSYWYFKGL